jgi:chaperonin cofactor prefoldin
LNSAELEEARRSLSLLEQQVETLKARQSNLEADERVKENQHQDLQSKIGNLKRTIQANIADFSNKQVQIQ